MSAQAPDGVDIHRHGAVGHIVLNRPKALNALDRVMAGAIHAALGGWAEDDELAAAVIEGEGGRAFCAGGDVRALVMAMREDRAAGLAQAEAFFRTEYRMNRAIATFPKPYIALIGGVCMGGGVGLSVHGSHRIVTESTLWAMPETAIGIFPDVGLSHFLSKLPGRMGIFLGLTGARLNAADLIALGIATHCVRDSELAAVRRELLAIEQAGDADAVLDRFAADPGRSSLAPQSDAIDRLFAADSVNGILAALADDGSAFAEETAASLRMMSPLAMAVTLRMIREAPDDIDAALAREFAVMNRLIQEADFSEGIRAVLIDKDRQPRWEHDLAENVSKALVDDILAARPDRPLSFP